jgi:C_GCAxxG_C_C family probable redox protein
MAPLTVTTTQTQGCSACGRAGAAGPAAGSLETPGVISAGRSEAALDQSRADEIKGRAYGHFMAGRHCAEVMVATVLAPVAPDALALLIKAASGFGGGIAGSTEELCGAFTGGVLALSAVLGREAPGEELRDLGLALLDFKERFAAEFGSLNCGTILDGFGEQGHQTGCARLTATAAVMVTEILEDIQPAAQGIEARPARPKVSLGTCPFSLASLT